MRFLVAGGSGFLGAALKSLLERQGHHVRTLTRHAKAGDSTNREWHPDGSVGPWAAELAETDVLVNLAGENIAEGRWTAKRKASLKNSRILATRSLVSALHSIDKPPRAFLSASAVGYYGARGDERITENDGPGDDFLATLCVEWEREALAADRVTRLVSLRSGLPLATHGGALKKMLLPFKLGAGATIGSGRQYMPWIHLDDWASMVAWLAANDQAQGPFNVTAPEPETNARFTQALARALHRYALVRAPAFALELALGEMAGALLTGQRAVPARAEELGFRFAFRDLEAALAAILTPR